MDMTGEEPPGDSIEATSWPSVEVVVWSSLRARSTSDMRHRPEVRRAERATSFLELDPSLDGRLCCDDARDEVEPVVSKTEDAIDGGLDRLLRVPLVKRAC
jgi:hypothetical protein